MQRLAGGKFQLGTMLFHPKSDGAGGGVSSRGELGLAGTVRPDTGASRGGRALAWPRWWLKVAGGRRWRRKMKRERNKIKRARLKFCF